jgi:hypothetical protein
MPSSDGTPVAVLSIFPARIIQFRVVPGRGPRYFVFDAKNVLPEFDAKTSHFGPVLTCAEPDKQAQDTSIFVSHELI